MVKLGGLRLAMGGSAQGEVWLESLAPVMGGRGDEWRWHQIRKKQVWGLGDEFSFRHVELGVPMGHLGEGVQQEVGNLSQGPLQTCGLETGIWEPSVYGWSYSKGNGRDSPGRVGEAAE